MDSINADVLASLSIAELPNWVVWREELRGKGTTKVPYTPGTKTKAESNNPNTWRSLAQALDAYHEEQGNWSGVGFNFSYSGVVGIDLDDCVRDDGSIEQWAQEIVDAIDSYTEISASGRGLHIIVQGELPVKGAVKHPIEAYMAERYFALTGFVVGNRNKILPRQDALIDFYVRTFGRSADSSGASKQAVEQHRDVSGEDIANAAKWLEQLKPERCDDYDSWLKVGMALSELGEVGLALWDRWSAKSKKYEPGVCRKKWSTITPGDGITLFSLRHWAEEDAADTRGAVAQTTFRVANRVFSVRNDCVFVSSKNGERQLSTFMFYPKRLLVDEDQGGEDALLGDIASSGLRWEDMVLPKSAFSTASALCKALPSIYWQWMGNDNDTKMFLMYICDILERNGMPKARSTAVIGRHGDYWVTKDITLGRDAVYSRADAPILYRSSEVFTRNKLSDTAPNVTLVLNDYETQYSLAHNIADNLRSLNRIDAVALMTGWFFACPLKAVFQEAGIRFPHLNVFGTKGSGKTTTILRVFLPLLGVPNPATWTPNTTTFVIRSLFSSTNAIPISVGEFRAATLQTTRSDFLRILLMAYDSGRDARGQADLSTKTYDLLAPVVVDGEDALSDPAVRERTIFVNLHPEDITDGSQAFSALEALTAMPLSEFSGDFIRFTLGYNADDILRLYYHYLEYTKQGSLNLPHRMRGNIAVVMCGLHIYNEYMNQFGAATIPVDITYFDPMVKEQGILLSDGRSRSVVDDFVETVVTYTAGASEFRYGFLLHYDNNTNVLWFHLPSAHAWWQAHLRRRGLNGLEMSALRAQLIERSMDGYILPETCIESPSQGRLMCFGISLKRCIEDGLNVPEKLNPDVVELRGGL